MRVGNVTVIAGTPQNDIRVARNFFFRTPRRASMLRSTPASSLARSTPRRVSPARAPRACSNVRAPTRASAAASTAAMTTTTRTIWRVNKTGALSGLERVDGDELAPPPEPPVIGLDAGLDGLGGALHGSSLLLLGAAAAPGVAPGAIPENIGRTGV